MGLVTPPPASPQHRQEQFELAARALQILALVVLVVVLAGPTLSPALATSPGQQLIGFLLAVTLVGLGFMLLGRMPVDTRLSSRTDDR